MKVDLALPGLESEIADNKLMPANTCQWGKPDDFIHNCAKTLTESCAREAQLNRIL